MNSEIQSLQSGLYEILDLFEAIKSANPTICSGAAVMSDELRLTQSGYIYLQACGSDGSEWIQDEGSIKEGIHLRWALRKELAENHIPKGTLANTGQTYFSRTGYSKDDDFVTIRKTPFINRVPATINLATNNPYLVKSLNGCVRWVFNVNTPGTTINNKVYFHFYNLTAYNNILIDPKVNASGFLSAYQDFIEIEVENKLFFNIEVSVVNNAGPCIYKFESVYVSEPGSLDDIAITCRKDVNDSSPSITTHTSENIRFFKLKVEQGVLDQISIETYYDFINSRTWNHVDDFGLTIDDNIAASRLMTNDIDDAWPKFNDGVKVKAANYTDKWTSTGGLKEAVTDYLDISRVDTRAYSLMSNDDPNDDSNINMSYVDLLNLVSLDFHIARMFGLGHIENFDLQGNKYVYLAEYYTSPELPFNPGASLKKHLFMSLPTDKNDKRLPQQPILNDLSFGLPSLDDCNSEGIIDQDGYSKIKQVRYVNVNRDVYDYEIPYQSFFETNQNFDTSQIVKPVFYGIEYRPESSSNYIKPEITSDPNEQNYFDFFTGNPSGIAEVIPVPEKQNPLFTHEENEEGLHHYAIYSVNWFNRSSLKSSEESVSTTFPIFNKLVPPTDLAAHYIQTEKPRLFSSLAEQNQLADRILNAPTADNFWTRVTFNWSHIQKIAYQTADELEFFYRKEAALTVKGRVNSLTNIADGKYVWVESANYRINSASGNSIIEPLLDNTDFSKFIGSNMVTATGEFEIVEIQQGTNYPRFKVKKQIETRIFVDPDKDNLLRNLCIPIGPSKGEYFTIYENLSNETNWIKLDKSIELVDFGNTTETIQENDGSSTEYTIGGIFGSAEIEKDSDINPGPDPAPISGLYRITFDTEVLADHPQKVSEHVYWDKGIIRLPEDTSEARMKSLQVVSIENQNPLVVWAMDAVSDDPSYNPVKTGSSINVNFHPGYKVYIEPESNNDFDNSNLMPEEGEEKRIMLLAVRSKHELQNPALTLVSGLSSPAAFFSLDIAEPKKPNQLVGPSPLYATRPDIKGKSSFTFDTEISSAPFALIPYRCHDTALLDALYESTTIDSIREDLEAIENNTGESQRFFELANVLFDVTPGHEEEFSEYDGYRFPFPDKEGLFEVNDTFEEKVIKIKLAVQSSFMPILEQPSIYQFVKSDGTSPENTKPVMRDLNGSMLDVNDPKFNPFPNVRKFSANNKNYVRFSDFGLDGGTKNYYFYSLREMSKKMEIGEMSEVLGPVYLVNTYPPESPAIRKIVTVLANPLAEINAGVQFEINPYFDSEDVKKVRIYRTIQQELAASVRTMELAGDFDLNEPLIDEFNDLDFPPFGKDIYYRLVALRKIRNEFEETEFVPSKPSDIRVARVVDNINPPSPGVIANIGATLPTPPQLQNVDLNWSETCFEGKYYLYKMSDAGMWQLVQSYNYNDSLTFHYNDLPKVDDDGDTIYHRFKVVAENANGLLSLDELILVI